MRLLSKQRKDLRMYQLTSWMKKILKAIKARVLEAGCRRQ